MTIASLLNPAPLFVEIGPDWIKARRGQAGVKLALERGADGRISAPGKAQVIAALGEFLKMRNWQPRGRAWCAIGSRGISLRRLTLPGGTKEEFQSRLLLQVEAEFPLSPDELAWGYQTLGRPQPATGVVPAQDLLVAAVRKDLVADYQEILRACGLDPVFTLAAMARWHEAGQPGNSIALLDVGPSQSELTLFENGVPSASRIVFWDAKNAANPEPTELAALAQNFKGSVTGGKLLVSGDGLAKDFAERLTAAMGNGCKCERLEAPAAANSSAAIAGLEKLAAHGDGPPLAIRFDPAKTSGASASFATLDWKTWGTRIGVLAAVALLLPYAEAFLLKPHLEKRVNEFKAEAARLKVIDRERDFLRDLKMSQPPYLDVVYVLAKSVPPGTHFDALSLNSHGEVSLRCAFHDGQQVADFRNQLTASGFFTNIVVEEQTPTPDHQRVNVRISAVEKHAAELLAASARLTVEDTDKNAKKPAPGMPPTSPAGPSGLRKEPK